MIVATAGHIDHGKTLLVKTLTGVDTDRLPEEKARGISIDLGFAYLPLAGGGLIGFVDVPGHERFIRNMLAGVCGIDFALLVVAADDGVMPQTVEHLHILDLLHVARGAAVITKTDRVDAARVQRSARERRGAARDDAARATRRCCRCPRSRARASTSCARCSSREASRALGAPAPRDSTSATRSTARSRVAGSGTVVTGTVFNGAVKTGDKLVVSPAGLAGARARHPDPRQGRRARGRRRALRAQPDRRRTRRRAARRLGARAKRCTVRRSASMRASRVLDAEAHALEHWTPVHLHLATSDVTARVATRRGASVAPGASAVVQLVLDQPVVRAARRSLHPARPVGDAHARRRLRARSVRAGDPPQHARRGSPSSPRSSTTTPEAALAALLEASERPIDLARFELVYNLRARARGEALRSARIVAARQGRARRRARRRATTPCATRVLAALAEFHRKQPQAAGQDVEALRKALAPDFSADAFGDRAAPARRRAQDRSERLDRAAARAQRDRERRRRPPVADGAAGARSRGLQRAAGARSRAAGEAEGSRSSRISCTARRRPAK